MESDGRQILCHIPDGKRCVEITLAASFDSRGIPRRKLGGFWSKNGRVFDPVLGRFMSADPNVPEPSDMQSYNRYSYVRNNPLTYVDMTGFWDGMWNPLPAFASLKARITSVSSDSPGVAKTDKSGLGASDTLAKQVDASKTSSGNSAINGVVRDGMLSSPNPAVAHAAACVGSEVACIGGLSVGFGSGWLSSFKLGRAALALFGFGSEVQNLADGAPPAGSLGKSSRSLLLD